MKKFYPILVQIEHVDEKKDLRGVIYSINQLLKEEEDLNSFFKVYSKIELSPRKELVNKILLEALKNN
jgi:hypothetical protein